jgi:hypothetical protein
MNRVLVDVLSPASVAEILLVCNEDGRHTVTLHDCPCTMFCRISVDIIAFRAVEDGDVRQIPSRFNDAAAAWGGKGPVGLLWFNGDGIDVILRGCASLIAGFLREGTVLDLDLVLRSFHQVKFGGGAERRDGDDVVDSLAVATEVVLVVGVW